MLRIRNGGPWLLALAFGGLACASNATPERSDGSTHSVGSAGSAGSVSGVAGAGASGAGQGDGGPPSDDAHAPPGDASGPSTNGEAGVNAPDATTEVAPDRQ